MEDGPTAVPKDTEVTAEARTEEAAMAALTEGAATDARLKVAVMVILQREEAATAHPREVSARQAEVSLHQAEGHSALETAVTTEQEEADSRAADLQEEAQLHAETDVEWMPREPRPNRIHTNSTRLTSRI